MIDQFYANRRSSGSFRSSFRYKRPVERSPSRKSAAVDEPELPPAPSEHPAPAEIKPAEPEIDTMGKSVSDLKLNSAEGASPTREGDALASQLGGLSRTSSVRSAASPRLVHFSDDECVEQV